MASLTNSLVLRKVVAAPVNVHVNASRISPKCPGAVTLRPVCALDEKKNFGALAATSVALSALFTPLGAKAIETETIQAALDQAEAFSKQAVDAASQAFDVAKDVTDQVVDVASPVVDAAAPALVKASKAAVDALSPLVSDLASQAQKALSESGFEIAPAVSAAKSAASVAGDVFSKTGDALEAASPYAQSSLEAVLAQDPTVLAAGAGGLLLVYLLAPGLASGLAYSARGYAGEFSAAQSLDLLSKEDYTLVDIRSDSQKSRSGVPSLPRNAKKKLVAVPVEELPGKLRSQIRNARKVEAEITALKISSLKRLSKGSRIIVIDSNGDSSKLVAQSLAALGLKRTWIVKDGMDGASGWVSSQLGTEDASASYSLAEVLLPNILSRGSGTIRVPSSSRKFLPSPSE